MRYIRGKEQDKGLENQYTITNNQKEIKMYIPIKDNERLSVTLNVSDGKYRVYVRKETVEIRESSKGTKYESVLTTPLADGNFCFVVYEGRKSLKKISTILDTLEHSKDFILEQWKQGNYQEIVNTVGWDIYCDLSGIQSQDFRQLV